MSHEKTFTHTFVRSTEKKLENVLIGRRQDRVQGARTLSTNVLRQVQTLTQKTDGRKEQKKKAKRHLCHTGLMSDAFFSFLLVGFLCTLLFLLKTIFRGKGHLVMYSVFLSIGEYIFSPVLFRFASLTGSHSLFLLPCVL